MATGLRRLDSFERHKDSFTKLFSDCVGKMKSSPNIRNPQALEVLQQQIKDKFGSEVSQDLERIWDEFDADKNGELDKEENIKLTKNFLIHMKDWFVRMMEEVLAVTANPDLAKSEAKAETFAKNVFEGSTVELKPVIDELFSKLIADVKPMAEEAFQLMDLDKDGKVFKVDFLNTFVSCASEIIQQLTLRVMYAVLSSGKVDFSKFVDDLDEDPSSEDSTTIKQNFNDSVREIASAQLNTPNPISLHDFWAAVCAALRKKVGCEISVKRGEIPLTGYSPLPFTTSYGYPGYSPLPYTTSNSYSGYSPLPYTTSNSYSGYSPLPCATSYGYSGNLSSPFTAISSVVPAAAYPPGPVSYLTGATSVPRFSGASTSVGRHVGNPMPFQYTPQGPAPLPTPTPAPLGFLPAQAGWTLGAAFNQGYSSYSGIQGYPSLTSYGSYPTTTLNTTTPVFPASARSYMGRPTGFMSSPWGAPTYYGSTNYTGV